MAFPLPPKSMGPPLVWLLGSVPGTRRGHRPLGRRGLAAARGDLTEAGAGARPPGAARRRELQNRESRGAVRTLQAQPPRGLLREGCWGVVAIGQSGNRGLSGRNARELAGPGRPRAKGAGPRRRRGGCGGSGHRLSRSPALGDPHRRSDPAATDPQGIRDQTASAGSLFSSSECAAAERRQFVGKQTPGRGRCRPAASLSRTRAPHTPPRGALGLTRRDRRDRASPHPHPRPGFRFRQGPRCAGDTEAPAGPRGPRSDPPSWLCPCGSPPFRAPWEAEVLHEPGQNPPSRRRVLFDDYREGAGNTAGLSWWPRFPVCAGPASELRYPRP